MVYAIQSVYRVFTEYRCIVKPVIEPHVQTVTSRPILLQILTHLAPLFFSRFPHPVSFAGTLEMGRCFLPIDDGWTQFINNCEETFKDGVGAAENSQADRQPLLLANRERRVRQGPLALGLGLERVFYQD